MPSFTARAISFVLRTTGVYKKMFSGGPDFPERQAKALSVPSDPSAKNRKQCQVEQSEFEGRPVFTLSPKDRAPVTDVLYWHGGGYVYAASPAHWDYAAHMAAQHGWRITMPLYPLAPMQEVEAITGFALAYTQHYADARGDKPFIMAGDSAGGGLTAAVLMAMRDAGQALPAKAILICPWLEADPAHADQPTIEPRDAILTIKGIREAGELYAGAVGTRDPRVSPIHGDWNGLPPILAFAGGNDILVTDGRALKAKLPSIDYQELAGMIHDWPIFFFPESRAAQARMAAFAVG